MRTFVEITDNERRDEITGKPILTGRIFRTDPTNVIDLQTRPLDGNDEKEDQKIRDDFKKKLENDAAKYKAKADGAAKAAK